MHNAEVKIKFSVTPPRRFFDRADLVWGILVLGRLLVRFWQEPSPTFVTMSLLKHIASCFDLGQERYAGLDVNVNLALEVSFANFDSATLALAGDDE